MSVSDDASLDAPTNTDDERDHEDCDFGLWERPDDEEADEQFAYVERLYDLWANADAHVAREWGRDHGGDGRRDLFREMVTGEHIRQLPKATELVEGWLPDVGVVVIYSAPGIGKTFLALDLAEKVRRGLPWFGHRVRQGAVMVLEAEGLEQLSNRLDSFDSAHGVAAPDVTDLLKYLDSALNLTDPKAVADVVRAGVRMEMVTGLSVAMVLVDPLIDYMDGDENADGTNELARGLRVIARLLRCCVVGLHHANAEGSRPRGNDRLKGRVTTQIRVTQKNGILSLETEKQRNGVELSKDLYMVTRGKSLVLEAVPPKPAVTPPNADRSEVDAEALRILLEVVTERPGRSQKQLLDAAMKRGVGTPRLEKEIRRIKEAGEQGPIEVRRVGRSFRYSPRPPTHLPQG